MPFWTISTSLSAEVEFKNHHSADAVVAVAVPIERSAVAVHVDGQFAAVGRKTAVVPGDVVAVPFVVPASRETAGGLEDAAVELNAACDGDDARAASKTPAAMMVRPLSPLLSP